MLILVDSDAHSARRASTLLRYGIATARRGWLTAEQVANTRSWKDFAPLRKRARCPGRETAGIEGRIRGPAVGLAHIT